MEKDRMISAIVCSSDGELDMIGPVSSFANQSDFDKAEEEIRYFDNGANHVYVNIDRIIRCSEPQIGDHVILINTDNNHIDQSTECFSGVFKEVEYFEDFGTCWIDDKKIDMVSEGGSFHLYKILTK
jgi:hypothetical protein